MVYSATECIAFCAAAVVAWSIAGVVISRANRLGRLDLPNDRSSHSVPTPRGGGLGIVLGVLSVSPLLIPARLEVWILLVTSALMAAIGWLDDRYSLSAKSRMLGYLFLSFTFVTSVLWTTPFSFWAGVFLSLFFILYLSWLSNLTNFMDGVDGIAASHVTVSSFISAVLLNSFDSGPHWLNSCFVLLAAATFGFLIRNWQPARVFMGDVGSVFIGYFFAGLVVVLVAEVPHESAVRIFFALNLAYATFTVDSTVTLIVRLLTKQKLSQAHRSHCYQVLVHRYGWTHAQVSMAYALVSIFWLGPWAAIVLEGMAFPTSLAVLLAIGPLVGVCLYVGAGQATSSLKHR